MSGIGKDTTFRIAGIVGLAILFGLVLWARQPWQSATHEYDLSDPDQHGHTVGGKVLNEHEAVT